VLQSDDAGKAALEQLLRIYDVRDRQPFLGAFQAPPPAAAPGPGMPRRRRRASRRRTGRHRGMPDLAAMVAAARAGAGRHR
jgi:hypothetical protein